jgi:crotonobetainyl-CoA:carnitine CoA-transferase CaiB-like acyl-CoA transferase
VKTGFEDIKVIEASSAVAGPMSSRLLADWGADVIHIDSTEGSMARAMSGANASQNAARQRTQNTTRQIVSDISYTAQNTSCNKRGMALNLSHDSGREIIYKLIEDADVFISNFRPRQLEKFKLRYEDLNPMNPRLICATLTGFGRKGPLQNEPGFGPSAGDCRSGLLHVLQEPGVAPVQMPIAYADFITAMTLTYGIMTALFIREKTSIAQTVDASLYNSVVYALANDIGGSLVSGEDRQSIDRKERAALMNFYPTKDDRWLYIMMTRQEVHWPKFCKAIEREDLANDSRFTSGDMSDEDSRALFDILDEVFRTKTLDEWRPIITAVGFPWAPVQNLPEVCSDPQAKENGFFAPMAHPKFGDIEIVANPIKLGITPEVEKRPAPEYNEHTVEILHEIGYTSEDIDRFKEQQVIL